METNEIILYQPDETMKLDVRVQQETVWLTQQQIAKLFGVKQPAISKHLKNTFESGELDENSVHSILEYTAADGKSYQTKFYNLDAILSVGYRVNSRNATLFRQWANKVLKEYLLRGYSVNQRLMLMEDRIDRRLSEHDRNRLVVQTLKSVRCICSLAISMTQPNSPSHAVAVVVTHRSLGTAIRMKMIAASSAAA